LANGKISNEQLENRHLENEKLENRRLENDIWRMKNIQHGLVHRGRSASGQVQNV